MFPVRRTPLDVALFRLKLVVLHVVISPYLLARAIYGRGAVGEQLVGAGTRQLPGGNIAQVLAERIPSARAVVAVGALVVALRAVIAPDRTWHTPVRWVYGTIKDGVVQGLEVMLAAPFVVLLLAAVLVGVARPGYRGGVARAAVRPAVVSVCGGAVLGLMLAHRTEVQRAITRIGAGEPTYLPLLGRVTVNDHPWLQIIYFWLALFFLVAPLVVHRNGVGTGRELPLLPPLATIGVVWLLLLSGLSGDPIAGLTGWRPALDVYGTPVTATLLALVEILWLRRVKAIGFRGPLPQPGQPPPADDTPRTPPPTRM